jgi:hypothetical protein
MKNYADICKAYACHNLCYFLILASSVVLLAAFSCRYYYGAVSSAINVKLVPAKVNCDLQSHNYVATQPYKVILKTLQNFPAECARNINKITITNSSALAATVEVVWV